MQNILLQINTILIKSANVIEFYCKFSDRVNHFLHKYVIIYD